MMELVEDYSNGNGYGLFCGRKCGDAKRAACTPFKRGAMKGQKPPECIEAERIAAQQQGQQGSASKAPIVIAIVVGLLALGGAIIYLRRKR